MLSLVFAARLSCNCSCKPGWVMIYEMSSAYIIYLQRAARAGRLKSVGDKHPYFVTPRVSRNVGPVKSSMVIDDVFIYMLSAMILVWG